MKGFCVSEFTLLRLQFDLYCSFRWGMFKVSGAQRRRGSHRPPAAHTQMRKFHLRSCYKSNRYTSNNGNLIQRQSVPYQRQKAVCHVNSFCCSALMNVLQILKEWGRGRRRGWGKMKVVYDLSLVCARVHVSPISNTKDAV